MARPRRVWPPIGWREWIALPGLGVEHIKVKVDTGARTSALHAFDIELVQRRGQQLARFLVHPLQRDTVTTIQAEAPIVDWRRIKSSNGQVEQRPVIRTVLGILDDQHEIDITLTRRDEMGFRMLLGREAVRGHFFVDPGGSYYNGKPPMKHRRKQ